MSTIAISIAFILIILFIIWPYLKAADSSYSDQKSNGYLAEVKSRRDNLLAAIKDIEFDHEMGKLDHEDFIDLQQSYRRKVIAVMREIDTSTNGQWKKKNRSQVSRGVEKRKSGVPVHFCVTCGTRVSEKDHYCGNCGDRLTEK